MVSCWMLWNHKYLRGIIKKNIIIKRKRFPQKMFERSFIYQNLKHLKRLPIKLFWNANQQNFIPTIFFVSTVRKMTLKNFFTVKIVACFTKIISYYTSALTRHYPRSDQNIFFLKFQIKTVERQTTCILSPMLITTSIL